MFTNTLNIILIINSLLTVFLILNQNESNKDSSNNISNSEIANPLQRITWLCIFLEFIILILKSKITDY
jgi:preprotein translocase subunit SecG